MKLMKVLLSALTVLLFAGPAHAVVIQWTGATNTDFNNLSNWAIGGVDASTLIDPVPTTPAPYNWSNGINADAVISNVSVTASNRVRFRNPNNQGAIKYSLTMDNAHLDMNGKELRQDSSTWSQGFTPITLMNGSTISNPTGVMDDLEFILMDTSSIQAQSYQRENAIRVDFQGTGTAEVLGGWNTSNWATGPAFAQAWIASGSVKINGVVDTDPTHYTITDNGLGGVIVGVPAQEPTGVPEPSTIVMLALGVLGLVYAARRRKR